MESISLYIHIPFCNGKCPYCDFYSKNVSNEAMDEYVNNLKRILEIKAKKYNRPIKTIYFGGGTPSLLGTSRICDILSCIYRNFEIIEDCETTLECNPNNLSLLDFKALKDAGINRISIGMQSSNDDELKAIGRKHTSNDVKSMVLCAQENGIDNISLDLMLCIPKQTYESINESIKFCASLNVKHVSAYLLKIEEGTPFYNIKNSLVLPDDDTQANMYEYAVEKLKECGFYQYEISNFSKKGYESKHNLTYWHDEEYLGLGPSAHSFINDERFYYNRSFEDFYNDNTIFESKGGDLKEYIMLNLRLTDGINFKTIKNKYNYEFNQSLINKAKTFEKEGLINISDTKISLTKKGFLVSNIVISQLLDFVD